MLSRHGRRIPYPRLTGQVTAGYGIRMPTDRDSMALSSWDAVSEPDDPYDQPMCDCCERVEVNRPGDICAACEPDTGRNTAADGAGEGFNDHPSPAPAYSPEVQAHERQRLHDLAEDYMREAAEEAGKPRPAAPSLPMDLCSEIPEDDR